MKATGIVRRIDDLGRFTIPKEIRRTMHIAEGDPMELFVEDDTILLRKYSPMPEALVTLRRLKAQLADLPTHGDGLRDAAAALEALIERSVAR